MVTGKIPQGLGGMPVPSSREIGGLMADRNLIFILDKRVIKADAWLHYHQSGLKVIQNIFGRDARDEVTAFVLLRRQISTLLTG